MGGHQAPCALLEQVAGACCSLSRAQDNHKLYKQKLEELTKLQDGISSSIARQKKRLKELSLSLKK